MLRVTVVKATKQTVPPGHLQTAAKFFFIKNIFIIFIIKNDNPLSIKHFSSFMSVWEDYVEVEAAAMTTNERAVEFLSSVEWDDEPNALEIALGLE